MMKKRNFWIGLGVIVALVAVAVVGSTLSRNAQFKSYVDKPSDVKKWTADPRPMQSEEAAMNQVRRANQANKNTGGEVDGIKLTVIPGLRGAWSINHKTGKAAFGNDWVPQGITQSNDNYYISLYDGDHKLNSLIVVLDRKTGKYQKSLILPDKAHVGGISYENQYKQLIYSDDVGGYAGFGVISQEDITNYDAAKEKVPIARKKIEWHMGTRTSAITTYKGNLVVAKYGQKSNEHSIILLPLNDKGLPTAMSKKKFQDISEKIAQEIVKNKVKEKDFFEYFLKYLLKEKIITGYEHGIDRMQGVSMTDIGLTVIAQSNGLANSSLYIQEQKLTNSKWQKLDFAVPFSKAPTIKVPRAVEEVSINNKVTSMSAIFESGAKKYRNKGFLFWRAGFMDRFVTVPITRSKD